MSPLDILAKYWPVLAASLPATLILTFVSAAVAAMLSVPLALMRVYLPAILQAPLRVYISFVRGTPLLAQMFLIFYGSAQFRGFYEDIGLWTFFRDPMNCALLAFIINSTAYQTEILRGGIAAVKPGEIEAAKAVGMSRISVLRRVTLPHAYRIAWPAIGNEVILVLKASALASVITVMDIMGRTRQIFSSTFDFSIYLWAALIYLLITTVFISIWRAIERHLSRHQNHQMLATQYLKTGDVTQ